MAAEDVSVFLDSLSRAIDRFQTLGEQRKQIDAELARLRQFMMATIELLDPSDREAWESIVESVVESWDATVSMTLTDSVKKILQTHFPDWLTAARVRDALIESGYDFSSYKSSELASVSTTLRRLKDEIEVRSIQGIAEYRLEPIRFGKGLREALERVRPTLRVDPGKLPAPITEAMYGITSDNSHRSKAHLPSAARGRGSSGQNDLEIQEIIHNVTRSRCLSNIRIRTSSPLVGDR